MPITISNRFAALKPRILRHTRSLLKSGALRLLPQTAAKLTIGFVFDIQTIGANLNSTAWSSPERIRVLLLSGKNVVGALDFSFVGARMKFSHALTGNYLTAPVSALNALEEKYRDESRRCSLVGLHFLLGRGLYFMVNRDDSSDFFQYRDGALSNMTREELITQFKNIVETRQTHPPKI